MQWSLTDEPLVSLVNIFLKNVMIKLQFTLKYHYKYYIMDNLWDFWDHNNMWRSQVALGRWATLAFDQLSTETDKELGVVSLTFRELSKTISWKYTVPEMTYVALVSCASWDGAQQHVAVFVGMLRLCVGAKSCEVLMTTRS